MLIIVTTNFRIVYTTVMLFEDRTQTADQYLNVCLTSDL